MKTDPPAGPGLDRPPIDPVVLALLRCPRSGRPLHLLTRDGRQTLCADDTVTEYQIVGGIPILLPIPSPAFSHIP